MLSINDRKWLIDPIQSPIHESDRLLVQKDRYTRAGRSHEGRVIKVKGYSIDGRRAWWIAEDGDHVYGAPVGSSALRNYVTAVGWLEDGTWFVGERYGYDSAAGTSIIRNLLRSDFMTLAVTSYGNKVITRDYVKGAPWALELMPTGQDSAEVVAAKLALAEQKWKMRWAQAEIIREALDRGWEDDLEEVREANSAMRRPVLGAVASGTAMVAVNVGATIDETERARLAALAAKGGSESALNIRNLMAPVPVRFTVDSQEFTEDALRTNTTAAARRIVQTKLDDYTATIGDITINPVLTSLASA